MPLHLWIAPFALVLLVLAAVLDVYGAALDRADARRAATALLVGGTAAALLAFATGERALQWALLRGAQGAERVEAHTQWGAVAVWLLAIVAVLRAFWRKRLQGARGWVALALAVGAAVLVVGVAASGLQLAHGG